MSKARLRRASKAKEQPENRSSRSNSLWLIGAGILLIGVIIFAAVMSSRTPSTTPSITSNTVTTLPVSAERTTLGNADAIVTVEMWEDFLCPACASWNKDVKPLLVGEYVEMGDSATAGTVKLEFHQFPLVNVHGPNAARAAEASECAADQDAFWPYHDRLFEENRTRGQQNRLDGFVYDAFVGYAEDLALDVDEFTQCIGIGSGKYAELVQESIEEAFAIPLGSTPSIRINGLLMPNPFSYNELKQEIDRLLAEETTES